MGGIYFNQENQSELHFVEGGGERKAPTLHVANTCSGYWYALIALVALKVTIYKPT